MSDMALEAFARCGIKAAQLTSEHMMNCRLSANLLLTNWSTRVPNLWLIQEMTLTLSQGVATYAIPNNVVTILDSFTRQFQLGNAVNETVAFNTTINSTTITITWPAHNQITGNWICVEVPVAVGGLVIQGNYQVINVVDANNLQITASSAATSTVAAGGVVPMFTSALASSTVTVTLPNHGLIAGNNFTIQVQVILSNLVLAASVYTVGTVISPDQFTITAFGLAGTATSVYENNGQAQFLQGSPNTPPYDRVMTPISRTDYSAQPNKTSQAFPTTFWFDRLINPQITFWQVPDQNGPYVFHYYAMVRPQDAVMSNGTTLDIPFRFYDAFAADLAKRLAVKYAPERYALLKTESDESWGMAFGEDNENSPIWITPQLEGYYRE
jgi:hypothetical protein